MKYLLFGSGERGRRAFEVIGSDQVEAFADSNPDKIGTVYCGKKIISFEQALKNYKECIYVITPDAGKDAIEERFRQQGIENYLFFGDCPMGITYSFETEKVFEQYPIQLESKCCGLYGITLFSLLLYEYLHQKYNIKVILIPQKNFSQGFLQFLMEEYTSLNLETAMCKVDCLVAIKEKADLYGMDVNRIPVYDIDELMEKSIRSYNGKIAELKGVHEGERCFIVATGPSLTVEDLEVLYAHNEFCISMNRIFNIFDGTEWRPDYYVIEDAKMIEDLSEDIAKLDLKYKFVASVPESYWEIPGADSAIKYHMIVQDDILKEIRFSPDVSKYVYNGRTVTYVCLQLAAYLGFKEIYLLGVDFNYSDNISGQENHFKGYEKDGKKVRLNPFRPEMSLSAYEKAKEYAETHHIKICNATRGGKLEVFERVNFDDLF